MYSSSGELRQKADEAKKKLTIFTAERWIDLRKAAELYQETSKILEEVKAADPRRRTFSVRPFRPDKEKIEETEEEEYKIAV